MGIKELWPILNPYCERKPLYELQGKVVAIDLAGWICESLCVVDYVVQAKFYLRNLFFRTCYLLLSGITPVFVLEGTAPALKHQVIAKRNQIQFRGAKPRPNSQQPPPTNKPSQDAAGQAKGRTRFNYVLKQCEELLRSMGLHCVQGPGEAEAFCAHLNACGAVDGVISQDSDCFAYGAVRVFRNFSLSMQGSVGSIGGSVDVYDLDVVRRSVDFGRNKIVVMALLCGCDYCPEGVGGVGRDAVQKLFSMYSEGEILSRIKAWREQASRFTELEMRVDDKQLCTSCGHFGRTQSHTKSGCAQCKTNKGCDASLWKDKRAAIKSELQIRKKAMVDDAFPSQEIIDEFLQDPGPVTSLRLDWCQPNVVKFVKMMSSMLQWDEIYSFQKMLPLLTRWQLHHFAEKPDESPTDGVVFPDYIKKKRTPKGIPSYEIVWTDEKRHFKHIIPEAQPQTFHTTDGKDGDQPNEDRRLWSTIEPMDLVERAYPELVERYMSSKERPKARKTKKNESAKAGTKANARAPRQMKRADKNKEHNDPLDSDHQTDKAIPKKRAKKLPSKQTKKAMSTEKLTTLDRFLVQQNIDSTPYQSPKIKTATQPMNLSAFSVDFDESHDGCSFDLSQIIDDMVVNAPKMTEFHGKRLRYDEIATTPKVHARATAAASDDENDRLDRIVARGHRRRALDRVMLAVPSNTADAKLMCSTPLAMPKSSPVGSECCLTPVSVQPVRDLNKSVIVCSFFGANDDHAAVDLFEKSVDFRNMDGDEGASDSENSDTGASSSSGVADDIAAHINGCDGDDGEENDTFDRLVGAGKLK